MQKRFRNARQHAFSFNIHNFVEQILLSNFVEIETINRTNRILKIFYDFQNSSTNKFCRTLKVRQSSIGSIVELFD